MNTSTFLQQRKLAARRQRRVIMNNDGDDVHGWVLPPDLPTSKMTPEVFWSQRCTGLEDTHVDSIFYCTTGSFNCHAHDSRIAELFVIEDNACASFSPHTSLVKHLIEQGRDCLQLIIDFCRTHNKEMFWTIRMNDIHDNWCPLMIPQFKKDHPQLMLYQPEDVGRVRTSPDWPEPHMLATAVDYAHPEIRDRQFAIIEEVCLRYDVDGIDLDFMRNPFLFRPTIEGRPCDKEHLDILTDFVRRVRHMTEDVGRRRDRPLLIATRVPTRIECCCASGIDIERWVADDLVDILAGAMENEPFTGPIGELAELGHRHDVPVYAGFGGGFGFAGMPDRLPCWAAAATNAYAAGADGIQTFNNFTPAEPMWNVIGDQAVLAKLDKVYSVEKLTAGIIRTKEHTYRLDDYLPAEIPQDQTLTINMPVAEDLTDAKLRQLSLRFLVDQMTHSDRIEFRFNDHVLEPQVVYATDGISPVAVSQFCLMANLDARAVHQGINKFTARLDQRCASVTGTPSISGLWLIIRYDH